LTHQGSLDEFWVSPEPVDASLAQDFVKALAATIQVKGDFYDPMGRKAAISEIVRRVLDNRVNEPGAFIDPPPRAVPLKRRPSR
nr:capsular biosynthesis protein [Beijerinckiaceae bacterium]